MAICGWTVIKKMLHLWNTWADAPEGKIKKSDVTVAKRKKEGIFCEDSVVQRLMKAEW